MLLSKLSEKEMYWRVTMKKISNLELGSLVIIEVVTMFAGINMTILKEGAGLNSWLSALISYIIGFIPVLLVLYLANYKPNLRLDKKINSLFGNILGFIINIILSLFLITIGITIFYNINNFILSQLLNRTPFLVSCLLLMISIVYNVNKAINVISKTSLILLTLNLGLFLINIFALIQHVDLNNFLPLLKENTNSILPTSIKIACTKSLPLLTILTIPKDKITNPDKYNKTVIISYIIATVISFLLVFVTCGVLGINLVKAFEYPEYIVLRKITLLGFLERIENIISFQWIIGSFVYLTIIMYNISISIPFKSVKAHKIINTIIGIILIALTMLIFKNNTIYDTYIIKVFPYIIAGMSIIYIILLIKILLSKKQSTN